MVTGFAILSGTISMVFVGAFAGLFTDIDKDMMDALDWAYFCNMQIGQIQRWTSVCL
jgi:hypothetical protein